MKKLYPWIPMFGVFLVKSSLPPYDKEYGLDNPIVYVGSLLWQCIASYLISSWIYL